MFYNFRKNKKAFTLVELIVVIAIIAILGAVVGVTVSSFVNRARESAATDPLNSLKGYWDGYVADGKTLSQMVSELFDASKSGFSASSDKWATKVSKIQSDATTFNIFYHDDNSGDYYGKLEIKDGKPGAVTSTQTAPTNTTAWK